MTAPQSLQAGSVKDAARVVRRMAQASFQVWRATNGLSHPHAVTGETLLEVERELSTEANYSETFLIAETLALSEKTTLHAVRIRRGKAIGWDANARRTYAYSADRLLSVAVGSFEPTLPWRWSPGCDVVGRDDTLIDARRQA